MDAKKLKETCIESCNQLYNYFTENRKNDYGLVVNEVLNYDILSDGYVTLHTENKVLDATGTKLVINGKSYDESDVNFEYFDGIHKTVTIRPSTEIFNTLLTSKNTASSLKYEAKIQLTTDLKWLIKRTRSYYESFGDMIGYPKTEPHFERGEYEFPKGVEPSSQQEDIVDTVLNSKMSYVWGAPGTGKTQYVLATAILAYIRKNKRVAVLAPTNNSLEQVLRGLLKILQREDPEGNVINLDKDVLRIGIATKEFVEEYPSICERKGISKEIKNKDETIRLLRDVLYEKSAEMLKPSFDQLDMLIPQMKEANVFQRRRLMNQIDPYFHEIKSILELGAKFSDIADSIDEYDIERKFTTLKSYLYDRPRPASELVQFRDWDLNKVIDELKELLEERDELDSQSTQARATSAKIIAMTPQTMMGRFGPEGIGGMNKIDVDHIFVDEVGYCNAINILPLFAYGVPITLLGDHMQLPPVCEVDEDILMKAATLGDVGDTEDKLHNLRYVFMWSQSAIHVEDYLANDLDQVMIRYYCDADPFYDLMKRKDLTISYRFGNNLAEILDKKVYNIGIKGVSRDPLEIVCIDARCTGRIDRVNIEEATAIKKYIDKEGLVEGEYIILTPYKKQMRAIGNLCPDKKDDVTVVHRSQGREWDTVILSVADNGDAITRSATGNPLIYTTSKEQHGLRVINTAVSRAKKKLVLVCDKNFWINQEGELIGMIAENADMTISF